MAAQQGKYLATVFNKNSHLFPRDSCTDETVSGESAQAGANNSLLGQVAPFKYAHFGSMASVGEWKGVIDTPNICKLMFCLLYLNCIEIYCNGFVLLMGASYHYPA